MTIAQLQVNLFCADVEACLAFYTALGAAEAFRTPLEGAADHVEAAVGGIRIGLTRADVANEIAGLGVAPGLAPASEIALWVDDAERYYERAVSVGAEPVRAPMDSPDGRLRYGWVRDPDGHQVKFIEER